MSASDYPFCRCFISFAVRRFAVAFAASPWAEWWEGMGVREKEGDLGSDDFKRNYSLFACSTCLSARLDTKPTVEGAVAWFSL